MRHRTENKSTGTQPMFAGGTAPVAAAILRSRPSAPARNSLPIPLAWPAATISSAALPAAAKGSDRYRRRRNSFPIARPASSIMSSAADRVDRGRRTLNRLVDRRHQPRRAAPATALSSGTPTRLSRRRSRKSPLVTALSAQWVGKRSLVLDVAEACQPSARKGVGG